MVSPLAHRVLPLPLLGSLLTATFWLCAQPRAQEPTQGLHEFRFAREDVLGSSSSLVVNAANEAAAHRAETAVFEEVTRLASVLSTWDASSELTRLMKAGGGRPSADLTTALQLAARWRTASHGAFEPGIAKLVSLWTESCKNGKFPADAELASAAASLQEPAWTLAEGQLTVRTPFTLDALAKGHIVDLASQKVQTVPGCELVSFQIGGDTRLGKTASPIALADPRHPAANGAMLMTLRVASGAVASSGGYARGFDLDGVHHSHILDPRTGKPCDGVLGASVVAKDTATADALATILCVLGPTEGLRLIEGMPGTEAVLVTADGKVHESKGLHALVVETTTEAAQANSNWPKDFALQVDFEIKAPATSGGRGRGGWKRPYIAVWIEDLTGTPARTLCLWGDERRWLRELRRWSRQNAETPRLIELVSQATRKAGSYTLTWDGTDDEGRALAPGRYTVILEASREHGSYQLMRKEIDLGQTAFHVEFEDNEEIGKGKITFGKVGKKGS